MMFLWQHALWLLLALPVLAGVYLVLMRRRQRVVMRYTRVAIARDALEGTSTLRRHLPPLLLLGALFALLLAAGRPVLLTTIPGTRGTVVLLMDVSLSMAASDVAPTRLDAARAAAKAFVEAQPKDVAIAVVAFGAHADVVQGPTRSRADVLAALDQLELQRFTALGNGIMGALLTIDPAAEVPEGYDIFGAGRPPRGAYALATGSTGPAIATPRVPVAPGSDPSAAIILVSDGRGTMGVPPINAAKLAARYGIRIYTVGVGTLYGGVARVEGWPPIHAEFDEELLRAIADTTRGEYFLARNAEKVRTIYGKLGRRVVFEKEEREITALATAIGMLLTLAAAGLSLRWSSRPV